MDSEIISQQNLCCCKNHVSANKTSNKEQKYDWVSGKYS